MKRGIVGRASSRAVDDTVPVGLVYLAQVFDEDGPGVVKVGYSTNPQERVARIAAQMGADGTRVSLRLLAVFRGSARDEYDLHYSLRKTHASYNTHLPAGTKGSASGWYDDDERLRYVFKKMARLRGGMVYEWPSPDETAR